MIQISFLNIIIEKPLKHSYTHYLNCGLSSYLKMLPDANLDVFM